LLAEDLQPVVVRVALEKDSEKDSGLAELPAPPRPQ
jgi:hypothetical protein